MSDVSGNKSAGVKRLFWDIETSPNIGFFWRPGYRVRISHDNIIHERAVICICYKWHGERNVHHLTWNQGDDREMIEQFAEVMDNADELVAHNGDNFDMSWYNGRHLIHGLEPIAKSKTVDTYKMAVRNFNLNSYKLDYLSKLLLGEGKIHTEFDLWKKIVLLNDELSMKKMVKYCKRDVVLLEKVWERLRSYEDASTHVAVAESGDPRDKWKCAHCGSDNVMKSKTRTTAKGSVQHQMRCNDCGRYYSIANNAFRWYLECQ